MENSTEKASVFGLLLEMSWNRDIDGGDRLGESGGCPFLHHLRTSLTLDTTMSLALDEE